MLYEPMFNPTAIPNNVVSIFKLTTLARELADMVDTAHRDDLRDELNDYQRTLDETWVRGSW